MVQNFITGGSENLYSVQLCILAGVRVGLMIWAQLKDVRYLEDKREAGRREKKENFAQNMTKFALSLGISSLNRKPTSTITNKRTLSRTGPFKNKSLKSEASIAD